VRERVFHPREYNGRLETSSFLIRGLHSASVWDLARRVTPVGRSVHGRADLKIRDVRAAGLRIDANFNPCRHVDLIGWADPRTDKVRFNEQVVELVVASRRRRPLRPLPGTGEWVGD
jgi:hypothetical protein